MKKKLQVFISSTYIDLIEERQAAVEAVLGAGHIPAGMELFRAGDETQKDTIKKWIDESDVYVLLLGGRYGSIEPISGKSYTQWEYEYAGKQGKPRFSLVMKQNALDEKVKQKGATVIEVVNAAALEGFKKEVLSRTSEFFEDIKDIKYSITRKMLEYQADESLIGWISARDIETSSVLAHHVAKLTMENEKLKSQITTLEKQALASIKPEKPSNSENSDVVLDDSLEGIDSDDFFKRLDRILKLINAEKLKDYIPITWVDEEGSYTLQQPHGNLKPYFIMTEKGSEEIKEILILAKVNFLYEISSALGDIRVTLSEYNNVTNMNILFLLAHPGKQPIKRDHAFRFFNNAFNKLDNKEKLKFGFDFWDEQKLQEIEKDFGLIL